MARDFHVYAWEEEPADERPSEFMRSTGYGGLFSTQNGALYNTQLGGFATTRGGVDSAADSGFTRPSPLPRERVVTPRQRFRELPVGVVLATILGGAAFLIYEFARVVQR